MTVCPSLFQILASNLSKHPSLRLTSVLTFNFARSSLQIGHLYVVDTKTPKRSLPPKIRCLVGGRLKVVYLDTVVVGPQTETTRRIFVIRISCFQH